MAQPQDPADKPQGIIRTMQQDIDRAQGRGGDAFEDIASASPLPPQAPQQSPDEILGMDIPVPGEPAPQAPPVFEPTPMPQPAPAPVPAPAPQAVPAPQTPATPTLSDEELDALLPLDGAPSVSTPVTPSAPPAPMPAPQAPSTPDFGSLTRRVTPETQSPSPIAQQAPQALPMDDIAPAPNTATVDFTQEAPGSSVRQPATPPANLPVGAGPQMNPVVSTPQTPPVFEPAPMPQPTPAPVPTPAPQAVPAPIPPFEPPAQQGLEEGEELPGQTPEELLGLGIEEPMAPAPMPAPQAVPAPQAPAPSEAPVFVEEKGSPISSRALIIVAGGLFVAALAGTLAYFFFFAGGSQQEPVAEEPQTLPIQEEPLVPPTPIMTPDRVDEISISRLSTQSLQTALARIADEDLPPGSITYLPVRLSEETSDGREQYLTAQLFFTTLGIALPDEFLATIDPTFMLYAYGPGEEEELVCGAESTTDTCPGPRLGIVLQARDGQEENVAALVPSWTALDMSTLEALILDEATLPTTTTFQQGTYSSASTETTGTIPVYYANLPHSATALNFAIAPGGKIVIGTSKNSLYAALDALLEEE